MGFKSVYRVLMDVFPQVDTRILRAVAIENSKDADKAVEVVLVEVLPSIASTSGSSNDSLKKASFKESTYRSVSKALDEGFPEVSSRDNGDGDQESEYDGKQVVSPVESGNPFEPSQSAVGRSTILSCDNAPSNLKCLVDNNLEQLCSNVNSLDINASAVKLSPPAVLEVPSHASEGNLLQTNDEVSEKTYMSDVLVDYSTVTDVIHYEHEPMQGKSTHELDFEHEGTDGISNPEVVESHASEDNLQQTNEEVSEEAYISDVLVDYSTVTEVIDYEHEPIQEKSTHDLDFKHEGTDDISNREVVESHASVDIRQQTTNEVSEETYISNVLVDYSPIAEAIDYEHEPMQRKSTHELDFEHERTDDISNREAVELVDEHALDTTVSRSGQICRVDLLEDIIKEARDNKKTLFSAMESVMSLMREVEVKEKAAELVKEEAARGPLDILASVDDLKQMLLHAREANDMHAGEVYGEKAILATEAKELQSRLLYLSDERDNSLAILDEMRQTLEQRLDAAEKEMKAAEQEKIEKEECARNALAEQQLLMDKLVQESKLLKQESEENSKLQEFLMDRGSVVDTLQGEISVICQDVKLLKQKFDEKVPLSESLSSSQTSCRLASSSSSLKNFPIDQVPMQIETALETLKQASPVSSISDHFSSAEEAEAKDRYTQVDDDGWEFCDNTELNM